MAAPDPRDVDLGGKRGPDVGAARLTIDVPGATDFIAIRPMESTQLRRERAQRAKTANSPLPEPLRWIPKVINTLDDAQDLLFTALVLAKPWLLRLPLKLIPGVGWALLANDVLNLLTFIASMALNGPRNKARGAKLVDAITGQSGRSYKNVQKFVQGNHKISALIQGSQALYTVTDWAGKKLQEYGVFGSAKHPTPTGVGIQLGAAMGMATDMTYGAIRAGLGDKIEFRGPPPSDPVSKAVRYLTQSAEMPYFHDVLSPEDHTLLILANMAAIQIVSEQMDTARLTARYNAVTAIKPPAAFLWNPASIAVMKEMGVDTAAPTAQLSAGSTPHRTFGDLLQNAAELTPAWERAMPAVFGSTAHAQLMQMVHDQAGDLALSVGLNNGEPSAAIHTVESQIMLRMIEWNRFPITWESAERAQLLEAEGDYLQLAAEFNPAGRMSAMLDQLAAQLLAHQRSAPTKHELEAALVAAFGGWKVRN